MLSLSFKVSSIFYCTIYKLTSKQILPVIILSIRDGRMISISLVCLSMFRPKKSLKLICFINGTIIPPNDGRENIYFEMESKQEDNAETYDDVVFRKDTPQAKPNVETQPYKDSDTVKHNPLFFIASAIAVASLLTALATLVLAVAIMTARSEASTGMATIAPSCCK